MSSVDEIKAAIEQLPPGQKAHLLQWASDLAEDEWDHQIAADAERGKLDKILDRVRADIRSGNVREMP